MVGDDVDAGHVRGGHDLAGRQVRHRRLRRRVPGRGLGVGGVVAVLAPDERVLAHRGHGHEFLARVPTDLARLRLDGTEREPAAREHLPVGLVHRVVAALQPVEVGVEGVGVLHQELTAAEHAEPGSELVAVLPVDLVQVHRQVAVARVLARDEGGHDLLRGRCHRVPVVPTVLDPEHHRPVGRVAPRLPPTARSAAGSGTSPPARPPRPSPRARSARCCASTRSPSGSHE